MAKKNKLKLHISSTNSKGVETLHSIVDKNVDKALRMRWRLKFGNMTASFFVHDLIGKPGKRIVYEGNSLSDAIAVYNSIY